MDPGGRDPVFEYRALAETVGQTELPFALWEAPSATIRLVNRAFEERVGVEAHQLVGRPWPECWHPREAALACATAVARGAVEALWAKRRIEHHGSTERVWVWVRRVMLGNMVGGLTVIVPDVDLHSFERDGRTDWPHSICIATGIADERWHIQHASAELEEITNVPVSALVGRPLADVVGFSGGEPVARRRVASWTGMSEQVTVRRVGDRPVVASFACAPLEDALHRRTLFAIIAEVPAPDAARADELERHLRRIGAELRAAGVLDKMDALFDLVGSATLDGLTTRQWEILGRLRQGERVASIASHLYLSQSTVRNHLSVIFRKFGVHSQAELMERLRR